MNIKEDVFIGNVSNIFKIDFKIFHFILLPDNTDNCYILKKNEKKNPIIF